MKLPITSLGLVASLVLSACGSSDHGTSTGKQSDAADPTDMDFTMPKSLRRSDDVTDNDANEFNDTNELAVSATDLARGTSSDKQGIVNEQEPHFLPASTLLLDSHMLRERLEFTQNQLTELDNVWEQVVSLCSAIDDTAICEIPAGTLSTDSREDSNNSFEYLTTRPIEYKRNPDETYNHSITFIDSVGAGDSVSEEYRWNHDKSRIHTALSGQWQFDGLTGTFASDLLYVDSQEGSKISLIEESKDGESEHKLSMQLQELAGEKNDIEAQTQSSWSFESDSGTTTSTVVANDDGGRLGSSSAFTNQDGTTLKVHSRHTFDADGEILLAEYCEETNGVDCSKTENWLSVDESELTSEAQIVAIGNHEANLAEYDVAINSNDTGPAVEHMELSEEELAALDIEFELQEFEITTLPAENDNYGEAISAIDADVDVTSDDSNIESIIIGQVDLESEKEFDWVSSDLNNEFNLNFAPEELELDFVAACQDMGVDHTECAFGEVLTLEGTFFSVENRSDAFRNACKELGVSEQDCTALEAVE